ncbi:MAG: hypothetical protein Ct9H300mP25_11270 [Acidobacteriota bacterium]|nr:MAG: hypothetical protein Ct9H300mP25_11270 [Acidobacteriota bacterium]
MTLFGGFRRLLYYNSGKFLVFGMRNKILLVQPQQGSWGAFVRHIPLGLLYTSASLVKDGDPITIYDCRLNPRGWEEDLRGLIDSETFPCWHFCVEGGHPSPRRQKFPRLSKVSIPKSNCVWRSACNV